MESQDITVDQRNKINEIISFWYPDQWDRHTSVNSDAMKLWWSGGEAIDNEIKEKFKSESEALEQN